MCEKMRIPVHVKNRRMGTKWSLISETFLPIGITIVIGGLGATSTYSNFRRQRCRKIR